MFSIKQPCISFRVCWKGVTLGFFRFLFERTGHLYRQYRARVAELKKSFDDTKSGIKSEPGTAAGVTKG